MPDDAVGGPDQVADTVVALVGIILRVVVERGGDLDFEAAHFEGQVVLGGEDAIRGDAGLAQDGMHAAGGEKAAGQAGRQGRGGEATDVIVIGVGDKDHIDAGDRAGLDGQGNEHFKDALAKLAAIFFYDGQHGIDQDDGAMRVDQDARHAQPDDLGGGGGGEKGRRDGVGG